MKLKITKEWLIKNFNSDVEEPSAGFFPYELFHNWVGLDSFIPLHAVVCKDCGITYTNQKGKICEKTST